jgi:hypothetical protein
VDDLRERSDAARVELRAGVQVQLVQSFRHADARPVRPLGGHRVEGVDGEDDPRLERDAVRDQPVRVALPIDALVVMSDHARLGVHAEASQQVLPCRGVVLDLLVLLGGERSGLLK